MRRTTQTLIVLALAASVLAGGASPPASANVASTTLAARHSGDGFGGQGPEPGTITVVTGEDPLGVAPFHVTVTCDNGVAEEWDLPAETELVAYSTTAADGLDTVICEVIQADTVVYETGEAEQTVSTSCFPQIPCDPSLGRVTFINTVPPVPGITVTKQTNGVDAATPGEAVVLDDGDEVTWTYVVTNSGQYTIDGLTLEVVDDVEGPVTCAAPEVFAPGETVTCEPLVGTATEDEYANTVTAAAEAYQCALVCPRVAVTAEDTSHYRLAPEVDASDPILPGAPPATPIATDAAFTG